MRNFKAFLILTLFTALAFAGVPAFAAGQPKINRDDPALIEDDELVLTIEPADKTNFAEIKRPDHKRAVDETRIKTRRKNNVE